MKYTEIVLELESRGIMPNRAPSLEPTREGLKRVLKGIPLDPKKTIVVAGTNGKGSVCSTLETLLISADQRVGLFTSPHLEETTERIRIGGENISQELFCLAYEAVFKNTEDLNLSHFEMLTLMAAWIFYSGTATPPAEWVIFEVGLGGTWDSTNAIPHQNSIITSLGFDHQNLLGNSLHEIAANKFGIVTQHSQVIYSPLPNEVKNLAAQIQNQTQSTWTESIALSWEVEHAEDGEPRFKIKTPWGHAQLALAGPRAVQNTATALTAFQKLGFSPESHLLALSQVQWPGRMEKVLHNQSLCPIYLSGDHNPQGVASLIDLLAYYPRKHLHIVVGVGKDKDLDGVLEPLSLLKDSTLYLTETPFKGRAIQDYGKWLLQSQAYPSPEQALLQVLKKANSEDLILVTGSLYLVGRLRKFILSSVSSRSILNR
jgi:dihydrofolate synthase/folylpolyglutamate synthase